MITITLENKEIAIKVDLFGNMPLFNAIINHLKHERFRWDPQEKKWFGPAYKLNDVKDYLEEKDTVNCSITDDEIMEILAGKPEMKVEKVRRVPDFSLMNYPPMIGKEGDYKNFQKVGITKGINRSRYAFFWNQGLGKSYVCATILAHRLYKYHDAGKCLLITTSIGQRNLQYELKKFIKGLTDDKILLGTKNCRNIFDDEYQDKDIIICSYNSFRLVCDYYRKQFKIKSQKPRKPFLPIEQWLNGQKGILVMDESHEAANINSQRGYLLHLHAEEFEYRYLFSGTPADVPEKLYNQLSILDPWLTYGLTYRQWLEKECNLGTFFSSSAIASWKKDELEKSNQRFVKLHGNYLASEDAIDLPEFNIKPIYLELSPYQRNIYERVTVSDLQNNIKAGRNSVRQFINRFPFLLLSLDCPYLLEKHEDKFDDDLNEILKHFKDDYMEKLHALDDIIEDCKSRKEDILVWAVHPKTIEIIGKRYPELNPICITGETKEEERNKLIEEFKTDDKRKLLVANIQTLNTSVTLTNATVQIYVELTFNYSQFAQSQKRIHRIGQTKPVMTYILLYNRTVNILQYKNLQSKGILTTKLLSKEFLSQSDWQQIYNCTEEDDLIEKYCKE